MSHAPATSSKSTVGFVIGFFLLVVVLSLIQFYAEAWSSRRPVEFTPLAPVELDHSVAWVGYRNVAFGYSLDYPSNCSIQAVSQDSAKSPSVSICGFDSFILDVLNVSNTSSTYPILKEPLADFAAHVRKLNAEGDRPNATVSQLQEVITPAGPAYRFSMEGTYRDFTGQTFPFSTRSTLTFYKPNKNLVLVVTRDADARALRMLDTLRFVK